MSLSVTASNATPLSGGRYDRSYDVTLVRREYLGKSIVAMNIMWAYAEQKSFQVRAQQHHVVLRRLQQARYLNQSGSSSWLNGSRLDPQHAAHRRGAHEPARLHRSSPQVWPLCLMPPEVVALSRIVLCGCCTL